MSKHRLRKQKYLLELDIPYLIKIFESFVVSSQAIVNHHTFSLISLHPEDSLSVE